MPPARGGTPVRTIFPHLGEVSFPEVLAKSLSKALNFLDAYRFGQREIHCRGVCLDPEGSHGFLKQVLIKHKICTLHVYIILATRTAAPQPARCAWRSWLDTTSQQS